MKKRIYNEIENDCDRKLLPGLHHVDWKDTGLSKDSTRYGAVFLRENEKKKLHKVTI